MGRIWQAYFKKKKFLSLWLFSSNPYTSGIISAMMQHVRQFLAGVRWIKSWAVFELPTRQKCSMLFAVDCMQLANWKVKSGIGQKYQIAILIQKKSACCINSHEMVCVHLRELIRIIPLSALVDASCCTLPCSSLLIIVWELQFFCLLQQNRDTSTSSVSSHLSSLHFILPSILPLRMTWRDSLIIHVNVIFPLTPFSIYCFPLSRCQLPRPLRFSKRSNQKVISCN